MYNHLKSINEFHFDSGARTFLHHVSTAWPRLDTQAEYGWSLSVRLLGLDSAACTSNIINLWTAVLDAGKSLVPWRPPYIY